MAAPQLVQSTLGFVDNSATPPTASFDANVTAGNFIAVAVQTDGGATRTVAVTDSLGNTYTQAGSYATQSSTRASLWYAENVTGGACTITVTQNTTAFVQFQAAEFSGVATSSAIDGTSTGNGSGSTVTAGSISVAQADDIVLASALHVIGGRYAKAGAGFAASCIGIGTAIGVCAIITGTASTAVTPTMRSYSTTASLNSADYVAAGASFKAASPGGGGTVYQRSRIVNGE